MNKRIKKKKLMNTPSFRERCSAIIFGDAAYAYYNAAEAGSIAGGHIRWRAFLKTINLRKRNCSIWEKSLIKEKINNEE